MTFRTSKKHKTQESTKSGKNALRLTSRFQRFLNTGIASKKDLKEIDERFSSQISQQGDKILKMLDQLKDIVTTSHANEILERTCNAWAKWLSSLDSREILGYSNVKYPDAAENALLESVIDMETHLFQMMLAYRSTISSGLKNPSGFDDRRLAAVQGGASEIFDAFQRRQKTLGKITASRR